MHSLQGEYGTWLVVAGLLANGRNQQEPLQDAISMCFGCCTVMSEQTLLLLAELMRQMKRSVSVHSVELLGPKQRWTAFIARTSSPSALPQVSVVLFYAHAAVYPTPCIAVYPRPCIAV